MIGVLSVGMLFWRARALRFLILFLAIWTGARVLMLWDPALQPPVPRGWPQQPTAFAAIGTNIPQPQRMVLRMAELHQSEHRDPHSDKRARVRPFVSQSGSAPGNAIGLPPSGDRVWLTSGRHSLRFALMARLLPAASTATQRAAFAGSAARFGQSAIPGAGALVPALSPGALPIWTGREKAGWSAAGWIYLRGGGTPATSGLAAAQLGGNQLGGRVAYGFGDAHRVSGYLRVAATPERGGQREAAVGIALAPLPQLPFDLHVEQRLAPRGRGRSALAVMVSGGVSGVGLPAGFHLDAYAQAGVVGMRSRDAFVDAAGSVEHDVVGRAGPRLSVGAMAAAAAQPGVARVDVGPRLSLRLPDVGKGSRMALDWRHRVAGDAKPTSGLALTLVADF